jgi:NAD+-processing family protein with receiver domain
MRLWLDDVREPWKHGFIASEWARTADEAIAALKTGEVTFASLDHDLSIDDTLGTPKGEKTGYDVVCWMEESDVWPRDGVVVHSMNPAGRSRMQAVIDRHYKRGSSSG